VRVVVLSRDLLIASRILDLARANGHESILVDDPDHLPPAIAVDRLFVNWDDRAPGWGASLAEWRHVNNSSPSRMILFGPHADLRAHADARAAGLGPMWARSKLVSVLSDELR
jgi:hypothetical protein